MRLLVLAFVLCWRRRKCGSRKQLFITVLFFGLLVALSLASIFWGSYGGIRGDIKSQRF